MAMTFKLTGVDQMIARIAAVAAGVEASLPKALREEAETVMATSKRDFVPRKEGTLRASGFVSDVTHSGLDAEVTLAYGGAASAYAIAVHETPSEHDPPSWRGKSVTFNPAGHGAKYLERPLMDAVGGMADRIAKKIELR
jgi:hypothetical protein